MAEVAEEYALPPLAVEDAVTAHQRPKLELYGEDKEQLFAVLKPVRYVDSEEVIETSEVAVFLGDGHVVTVVHGTTDVLDRARADLEDADGPCRGLAAEFGPAVVLYRLADVVVDDYERALDEIDLDVDQIEGQVFGTRTGDHSERIYKLKREVLEFRRAVLPLARPLERLSGDGLPHVPPTAAPYFRDVHDHVVRASERLEAVDGLLSDVLQANAARVSVGLSNVALRQNEDMRKISAWAAIALVPTAIAGIYGMNFEHMPELGWLYGYPMALTVMVTACTVLYRLFRRNGWL